MDYVILHYNNTFHNINKSGKYGKLMALKPRETIGDRVSGAGWS
jgi:hypothetical protein